MKPIKKLLNKPKTNEKDEVRMNIKYEYICNLEIINIKE